MKLLFDQNLSHKLVQRVDDLFPYSDHVRNLNMKSAPDSMIWQFAKENDFVIVSKDSDFQQRSFLYGSPPKVIWLQVGNTPTAEIEKMLRKNFNTIQQFDKNKDASLLMLSEI